MGGGCSSVNDLLMTRCIRDEHSAPTLASNQLPNLEHTQFDIVYLLLFYVKREVIFINQINLPKKQYLIGKNSEI